MAYQPYDPIQYSSPPGQYPPTTPYPDPSGYYDQASGMPYQPQQPSGPPASGSPYYATSGYAPASGGPAYYPAVPAVPYAPSVVLVSSPPSSGAATASLVLGIVGITFGWCLLGIPCILAVIFGHVGLAATRDNQRSGRGLAVAGLVLGYICVVPMIVFTFLVFGSWFAAGSSGSTY